MPAPNSPKPCRATGDGDGLAWGPVGWGVAGCPPVSPDTEGVPTQPCAGRRRRWHDWVDPVPGVVLWPWPPWQPHVPVPSGSRIFLFPVWPCVPNPDSALCPHPQCRHASLFPVPLCVPIPSAAVCPIPSAAQCPHFQCSCTSHPSYSPVSHPWCNRVSLSPMDPHVPIPGARCRALPHLRARQVSPHGD